MASEQTEIKPCCVTGHIHEGIPLGKFEIVHGLRTYISDPKPPGPGQKQDVVVIISDAFGVDLINAKLVADSWAGQGNGWKVLLPDFFEGGPIGIEHMNAIIPNLKIKQSEHTLIDQAKTTAEKAAALAPFLLNNREAVARPTIEKFFQAIRADPHTDKIIAIGFCWGGRYVLLLSKDDSPARVDVAVAYHPSFVVNADVEGITRTPVAVFKGDQDDIMDDAALDEIEKILRGQLGDKLFVKRYKDAVHGFAVRGDDQQPRERGFKEDAANEGIKFAQKWVSNPTSVSSAGV